MSDVPGVLRNPPDLVHSITLNETEKRWHADILATLFESFTVTSFNYKIGNDFCIERNLDTDITKVKSRCVSTYFKLYFTCLYHKNDTQNTTEKNCYKKKCGCHESDMLDPCFDRIFLTNPLPPEKYLPTMVNMSKLSLQCHPVINVDKTDHSLAVQHILMNSICPTKKYDNMSNEEDISN